MANPTDTIITGCFQRVFNDLNKSSDEYMRSLDIFKKGRKNYFKHLADKYGNIQILGMTRPSALADIYVSVKVNYEIENKRYINLTEIEANGDKYLKHLKKERNATSKNPLEVLGQCDQVTILGKPGCGKTTLLKYICLLYSGNIKNSFFDS